MLTFNLAPIFNARGVKKPYSFLVKAGISPHGAHTIINSNTRVLRLDHIEILCRILVCEPNDLLQFTPNSNQHLSPDHPLNGLLQNAAETDLNQTLSKIPFKQLKEITKQIRSES